MIQGKRMEKRGKGKGRIAAVLAAVLLVTSVTAMTGSADCVADLKNCAVSVSLSSDAIPSLIALSYNIRRFMKFTPFGRKLSARFLLASSFRLWSCLMTVPSLLELNLIPL